MEELSEADLSRLASRSRELCGCYECLGGPMEIGGHTIASPDNPRRTPRSCLADGIFEILCSNKMWHEAPKPDDGDEEAPLLRPMAYAVAVLFAILLIKLWAS